MIIIQSPSNSPTFNLAAEEYLFSESQEELLFLYVNEPSVVIGSNQAILNEVDMEYCLENNIQVVRRMSGGGAVYHDYGNLNYCFISNRVPGKLSLDTDFLLPVVEVLKDLKIDVFQGKRKDLWLPNGYKISGTASFISKSRELHHGTLLYDTKLKVLEKVLTSHTLNTNIKATASVHSPVKNIRTYFSEQKQEGLSRKVFFDLMRAKVLEFYHLKSFSFLSEQALERISTISKNKYQLSEWTFRK